MSVTAGIQAGVEQGRALFEQTLTDRVTITRDISMAVDDLGTEHASIVEVWEGPGLVQLEQSVARDVIGSSGEQRIDAQGYVLKVPVVGPPALAGAVVTVTDSLTPRHVGKQWRILADPTQGWQMLRRCLLDPIDPEVAP